MSAALSIVVPVYNAEELLLPLYQSICAALEKAAATPFECLFVNDATTDESLTCLRTLASSDKRVRVVSLEKNLGQQEATLCGISLARGRYIVNMDADLQHPAALILDMLQLLQTNGCDIVYAVSKQRRDRFSGLMRDLLFHALYRKSRGIRVSAFRVMTAALSKRVLSERRRFNYFSAMVFSRPVKAAHLYYPYRERPMGRSAYTFLKKLRLFVKIFVCYGLGCNSRALRGEYPIQEMIGFA